MLLMNMAKSLYVLYVNTDLDMPQMDKNRIPNDEELDKLFRLYRQYLTIGVYAQQRINMFDYIKEHWND